MTKQPEIRLIEEWKNQVAANDTQIPEDYIPEIATGEHNGQKFIEADGLGVKVRAYQRHKYSIGAVYADNG